MEPSAAAEASQFEAIEDRLRRLSAELHDDTLQTLGAVRMRLAAARRGSPEKLDAAVDEALDVLSAQIVSLRSLIGELRPATLDELGLGPALEDLATRRGAAAGLTVETENTLGENADARLEPELETLLFRIAQEALANVAIHAGAELVRVRLRRRIGSVELEVGDDGRGFDSASTPSGSSLAALRRRVAARGGSLRVTSARGAGTTVRARLPLAAS